LLTRDVALVPVQGNKMKMTATLLRQQAPAQADAASAKRAGRRDQA
jgi:hypothetical protein